MESRHEEFIRKNAGKLSPRQIAKATGLTRTEIERFIAAGRRGGPKPAISKPPSGTAQVMFPLALFAAALVFKLIFAHYFSQTPFFEPLSAPTPKKMDDGLYDLMGLEILGGNWMGDFPLGQYRLPGYAYFLAVCYRIFGHQIGAVHLLQASLGAFSVLMVYFLGREIFKDLRVGFAAGVLTLLYVPLSYYENFLLGETLAITLSLSAVYLAVRGLRGTRPVFGLLPAGVLFGISALFRPNVLLPCVLVGIFIFWELGVRSRRRGTGLAAAFVFLAACAAPLAPLTIRNWSLYKDFMPVSAIGGVNFYLGNNAQANGSFNETQGLSGNLDDILNESIEQAQTAAGRPLKASEVSAYWSNKAVAFLVSSPGQALRIFGLKLRNLLSNAEIPDILDQYFVARFMPLLELDRVVGIALILGLAVFSLPRLSGIGAGGALTAVFMAGYALSVLAIFVTSRYRLPLTPFMTVFAGAGILSAWEMLRSAKFLRLAGLAVFAVLVLTLSLRMKLPDFTATNYNRLAVYYQYRGDYPNAEKNFLKAIEAAPSEPYAYHNYAVLLQQMGRDEESDRMSEKSEELLTRAGLYNRFISSGSDTR